MGRAKTTFMHFQKGERIYGILSKHPQYCQSLRLVGFNTILEVTLKTTIKHLQEENKET